MVEFALILPLFVLFIIGIFELGRAFFAYIAITNATREGTRVVTFWPGKATIEDINSAMEAEIGNSPMVKWSNIISQPIVIECGNSYTPVTTDAQLHGCPSEQPIRVTLTYRFEFILKIFFTQPLILRRSAVMMIP
ncbi:MAG: TadE/TadG family type IV pilus assembly protein [Anaerolineales bacterium]